MSGAFRARPDALGSAAKAEVLPAVRDCILALNSVQEKHALIDTLEREELWEVITAALVAQGVPLEAGEDVTYEWRDW